MNGGFSQSARVLRVTVDDITDASCFPNIAAARAHYASLSPERRAELDGEWDNA